MIDEKDKQSLIKLIEWYRDEYHCVDAGHSELIEKIKATNSEKMLEFYEKIVDGWLDY